MDDKWLPIGDYVKDFVDFLLNHFQWLFDIIAASIGWVSGIVESLLTAMPIWLLGGLLVGLAFWRVGKGFALFTLAAIAVLHGIGLWDQTVVTLSLVLASTVAALIAGIPLGIWAARSDRVEAVVRSLLDFMQTMPAFVYLIPAAMFFGLGRVPGMFATVIFAMPPVVRLTNLGIRQVRREMIEAGLAFGCTPMQLLFKVQIPNAMPSIMAGINQTIMMALSMVVIASMIGAGGLGDEVLRGIQRLDVGLGFEGGLGMVLLAIILDRITESFGRGRKAPRAEH